MIMSIIWEDEDEKKSKSGSKDQYQIDRAQSNQQLASEKQRSNKDNKGERKRR